MSHHYLSILRDSVLSFALLLAITRILGNKQMSQITFFNYISGMTLGSIAAQAIMNPNVDIRQAAFGLLVWGGLTLLTSFVALKWRAFRSVANGQPLVVIQRGKLIEPALKRHQLSIDDVMMMIRKHNIFSLADVEFAVFETDGTLSVMPRNHAKTVTRSDLNLPSKEATMSYEIVVGGIVDQAKLRDAALSKDWVNQQLKRFGVARLKDVSYLEYSTDGTVIIDLFDADDGPAYHSDPHRKNATSENQASAPTTPAKKPQAASARPRQQPRRNRRPR